MTTPSRQTNYFNIGLFILVGIALIISAILLLNNQKLFSKTTYIETYFNESVQGLSTGSPVKYRGLDIGYVKNIAFVDEVYHNKMLSTPPYNRYIYVNMAITSSFLTKPPHKLKEPFATEEINKGLRVKLAQQGLTGNAYLELNYVDPKANRPLPIIWEPAHYYIPSSKSTLTHLTENTQSILDELKGVKFSSAFAHFEELTKTTNQVMKKTDQLLSRSQKKITYIVDNLENISHNMSLLTEQAKGYPSQMMFGNPPPELNPHNL